jgi:putative exosortase-associated protein (TIGR04073 family)
MKDLFTKIVSITLLVIFLLLISGICFAKGDRYDYNLYTRMSHKLLRGGCNIFFGWVEIPKFILHETYELDPFTGVFTGTYKGLKRTIVRTGAGIWEVFTFPMPVPSEYQPLVLPEFVLQDEVK